MLHTKRNSKIQLILPSLIQSKTRDREDSDTASIVTLNTPTGYPTNEDTESDTDSERSQLSISSRSSISSAPSDTVLTYKHHDFGSEDDDETSSSSSSDWEPSISLASTYLPRNNKKSNNKLELTTYNSLLETDKKSQLKLQELNDINNTLFYPYTNLQSLIFSNAYCYIQSDYKRIKNVNVTDDSNIIDNENADMDWNDIEPVNKIKELLRNLLLSASLTLGIREEEIYLMFSSPSPGQIIEQLRFGVLSILCDVHIDRFGRRSYYRKNINYNDKSNKIDIGNEEAHFYNHSHLPTQLFAPNDINNLSNFLTDSPTVHKTPMTPSTDLDSYPPLPEPNISSKMGKTLYDNDNNLSPPTYTSNKGRNNNIMKTMSEDKLDWKNIDYQPVKPVTYLLTKTKTTTYNNHNPQRTATDIGSKHNKKKATHKVSKMTILSSLPEKKETVERVKHVKPMANKTKSSTNKHNKSKLKSKTVNKQGNNDKINKQNKKLKPKSKTVNKQDNNDKINKQNKKLKPKSKGKTILTNNIKLSPKQKHKNKKRARVKRKALVFNDSDSALHDIKKGKRKVTFEDNINDNIVSVKKGSRNRVRLKNNGKGKGKGKGKGNTKMKAMGKQRSYSPKSKPMIMGNNNHKSQSAKKRRYTVEKPPKIIKMKAKKRSYSGHGTERDKNSKKMSADEFKNIDLLDIIDENKDLNDNYKIAKDIAKYFDNKFGDTDTVCLVSEINKHPSISYWIKGKYVRKDRNILNGKYVLVYRSCKHIPANQPIVGQNEFKRFVKDMSVRYVDKSVNFICEKLDDEFGDGCHFIRCNSKSYNCFDVYSRFSDQYECSFKLKESKHYIIAWRR